jgi:hypothetical protein
MGDIHDNNAGSTLAFIGLYFFMTRRHNATGHHRSKLQQRHWLTLQQVSMHHVMLCMQPIGQMPTQVMVAAASMGPNCLWPCT